MPPRRKAGHSLSTSGRHSSLRASNSRGTRWLVRNLAGYHLPAALDRRTANAGRTGLTRRGRVFRPCLTRSAAPSGLLRARRNDRLRTTLSGWCNRISLRLTGNFGWR